MKIQIMIMGIIFSSLCAAQTTLKPKFKVGFTKTYTNETKIKAGPVADEKKAQTFKYITDTRYTIKSLNKDSAVIEITITRFELPMTNNNEQINSNMFDSKVLLNKSLLFSFNTDGKLRHLLNTKDARCWMKEYLKGLSTEGDLDQLADKMITDSLMLQRVDKAEVFSLYGTPLKTGNTDMFEMQGFKIKRTYTVSDNAEKIDFIYSSGMTEDDAKLFLTNQLKKKTSKNVEEVIEKLWSEAKSMGMDIIKIEGSDNRVFTKDKWLDSSTQFIKTIFIEMKLEISATIKAIK